MTPSLMRLRRADVTFVRWCRSGMLPRSWPSKPGAQRSPPSDARQVRWILRWAAQRLATARGKKGGNGMASLTTVLAEILHTVQRPGDFYTTGTLDIFAPRLEVAGVGS